MSELRDSWQARILCAAKGRMAVVVPSILGCMESEPVMLLGLMYLLDPPCWDMSRMSLRTPFLCTTGKVNKHGQVVADVIEREVRVGPMRRRDKVLFSDLVDFRTELCWLADLCRLSDDERRRFFSASVKWLAADMRLDPTLDPNDPDSRRLTEGVRPAHAVVQ